LITLSQDDIPWVSRAGLKLDHAIAHWKLDLKGDSALDVGASTGGFTQVLLHHGVTQVFAVDVGTNQLAKILRDDPRVISMEQTHILELTPSKLPRVDIVVIDVSFISLTKILPHAIKFLKPGEKLIALIKPQFEVGKEVIDQNHGVVRDESLRTTVVDDIAELLGEKLGCVVHGVIESPIEGGDGNKEYLIYATL
jgi:23S rRNA (cytidine1920-2'-O)/16S rRNA (cytidine1409-2'-O)-methyltransferase